MPHPIDDDTAAALDAIRKTMLAIKIETRALGPSYKLAVAVTLLSDLVEVLLQREHTHGAAGEPQRFGG
jgi:hypothetical protein